MVEKRPMFWRRQIVEITLGALCALGCATHVLADSAPLGGFIPMVGIGLTNQFKNSNNDPTGTFFIADPSYSWSGTPLGPGTSGTYFDVALLDTGAATDILTQAAAGSTGFNLQSRGFRGTNSQTIYGASGAISLRIDNPLGVYAEALSHRTASGSTLTMDTSAMRGQTSFALLDAPASWTLPNIL